MFNYISIAKLCVKISCDMGLSDIYCTYVGPQMCMETNGCSYKTQCYVTKTFGKQYPTARFNSSIFFFLFSDHSFDPKTIEGCQEKYSFVYHRKMQLRIAKGDFVLQKEFNSLTRWSHTPRLQKTFLCSSFLRVWTFFNLQMHVGKMN